MTSLSRVLHPPPQIGDRNGELTARMNVEQLMEALGVNESDLSPSSSEFEMQGVRLFISMRHNLSSPPVLPVLTCPYVSSFL